MSPSEPRPASSPSPRSAPARSPRAVLARPPQLVFLAADVQDPGNTGAIVATAEAAGATGVVCGGASADPFGWKALRGSMGSAFRLPVAASADVEAAIAAARAAGLAIVATVPTGGRQPVRAGSHAARRRSCSAARAPACAATIVARADDGGVDSDGARRSSRSTSRSPPRCWSTRLPPARTQARSRSRHA